MLQKVSELYIANCHDQARFEKEQENEPFKFAVQPNSEVWVMHVTGHTLLIRLYFGAFVL